jgi:predicted RNA-binding Zn ribbon-like protein
VSATTWTDDHFVGGHVALDFCNTVYRRFPELGAELLDSTTAFRAWLDQVALVPDSAGAVDDASLAAALDLRASLWQAFDAHREGRAVAPKALAQILRCAQRGSDQVSLDQNGVITAAAPSGAVAALALAALQLLLNPPAPAVRACDGCGWFFVDTSRARRRRWCSMKTCGNEHKVARYRAVHGGR